MKTDIETGKYYKTRDGRKAYVIGKDVHTSLYPCVVSMIEAGRSTHYTHYRMTLRGMDNIVAENPRDLIEEWREPKSIKYWLNVYTGMVCEYKTREDADANAASDRLACIYIDVKEGDGL